MSTVKWGNMGMSLLNAKFNALQTPNGERVQLLPSLDALVVPFPTWITSRPDQTSTRLKVVILIVSQVGEVQIG